MYIFFIYFVRTSRSNYNYTLPYTINKFTTIILTLNYFRVHGLFLNSYKPFTKASILYLFANVNTRLIGELDIKEAFDEFERNKSLLRGLH